MGTPGILFGRPFRGDLLRTQPRAESFRPWAVLLCHFVALAVSPVRPLALDAGGPIWQAPPQRSFMSRFFRRLVSAVAMWAIALSVVFTGNEVVFFLLIAALGLAGFLEYFPIISKSGVRCFTAF